MTIMGLDVAGKPLPRDVRVPVYRYPRKVEPLMSSLKGFDGTVAPTLKSGRAGGNTTRRDGASPSPSPSPSPDPGLATSSLTSSTGVLPRLAVSPGGGAGAGYGAGAVVAGGGGGGGGAGVGSPGFSDGDVGDDIAAHGL